MVAPEALSLDAVLVVLYLVCVVASEVLSLEIAVMSTPDLCEEDEGPSRGSAFLAVLLPSAEVA